MKVRAITSKQPPTMASMRDAKHVAVHEVQIATAECGQRERKTSAILI
jgi:hypothetical protein